MDVIEEVHSGKQVIAVIIRAGWMPEKTTFVSSNESNFQLGCFVYHAGNEVRRHSHLRSERTIHETSEFLVVRKGRCEMDLYGEDHQLVRTVDLRQGDAVLLLAGGHGFRLMEDTVFLDIKQGPYRGPEEKERF